MSYKKRRNQKGGDISDVQLWGQEQVPPSSYKIQLGYVEVPKTIKFDEKWLDTPYRFKSFEDANQEAQRLFDGYQIRIVGSNDNPHWDAPSYLKRNMKAVQSQPWYDVVGMDPVRENPFSRYSPSGQPPVLDPEQEYALGELSKLRAPVQSKRASQLK